MHDLKIDTLHKLLLTYPNGLLEKGWDIDSLSCNRSLPFQYVKDNLHLPWKWDKIVANCRDMSYQDLMDHKSYWINADNIWHELSWSNYLCEELIDLFIDEADLEEVDIDVSKSLPSQHCDEIWENISSNWLLTRELMVKYMDNLNWKSLLNTSLDIDWDFINEYHDFFYNQYPEKYDGSIVSDSVECYSIELTEEFIDQYRHQLDWTTYRLLMRLDRRMINKYYGHFNSLSWYTICSNPKWLDERSPPDRSEDDSEDCIEFIYFHLDRLSWKQLSKYLLPYPEITKRFENLIKWDVFGEKNDWTLEQLEEYRDKLKELRFISLIIKKCFSQLQIDNYKLNWRHWEEISASEEITVDILEKYKNRLDYPILSKNSSVPYEFILNNPEKRWDNYALSKRTYLPSARGMRTKSANNK